MSERVRADDVVSQLRDAFAKGIAEILVGTPPSHALQAADHLCGIWRTVLAGVDVAMPARPKVDGPGIAEDWHRGLSVVEITLKHACSRRTAYNYHPNRRVRERQSRR